jgi:fructose/tagatose bisphosphate aldolase
VVEFIRSTGVDCLCAGHRNAHGMYSTTPLSQERVSEIVRRFPSRSPCPGGTGNEPRAVQRTLIARRPCAKVNSSLR